MNDGAMASILNAPEPLPFFKRPHVTVGVLTMLYAFSYLDRNLPSLLLPNIQRDLQLTDTEVSILTGTAFALIYVAASLPLARLADRWSRRGVIAAGTGCWGLMTTLCGGASTFRLFFLARMGVGLGEAAITPASNALIAALYPSGKRARPMSLMMLGLILGTAAAMLVGGAALAAFDASKIAFPNSFLADIPSWRLVLMSIGLATVLMVIPAMKIVDPPPEKTKDDDKMPSIRETLSEIGREKRAYAPLLFAFPYHSIGLFGFNTWIPTLFVRQHVWSVSETGVKLGIVTVVAGLAGATISSLAADKLANRSEFSPLAIALWCILGCTVITWLIVLIPNPIVQLALVACWHVTVFPISVMGLVALQEIARPKVRALVSSFVTMIVSLMGVGAGPTVIALFTDYVFQDRQAVGLSIGFAWLSVLVISGSIILFSRKAFVELVVKRRQALVMTKT